MIEKSARQGMRSLPEIRRELESLLFGVQEVAGISVKQRDVRVFLVHDSQHVRSEIDKIVRSQHPGAQLSYEVTGEFHAL